MRRCHTSPTIPPEVSNWRCLPIRRIGGTVPGVLDQRGRLLHAALGFAALGRREPELRLLHGWLDTWRGIGDIVAGMARQGYDLELRRYDGQGWRAMFFPSGFEHSFTSHAGSAWAASPWAAVQRAAHDALHKLEAGEPAPHDGTLTDESPT